MDDIGVVPSTSRLSKILYSHTYLPLWNSKRSTRNNGGLEMNIKEEEMNFGRIVYVGWGNPKEKDGDRIIFVEYHDGEEKRYLDIEPEEWRGKTPEEVYKDIIEKTGVEDDEYKREEWIKRIKCVMEKREVALINVDRLRKKARKMINTMEKFLNDLGKMMDNEEEATKLGMLFLVFRSRFMDEVEKVVDRIYEGEISPKVEDIINMGWHGD